MMLTYEKYFEILDEIRVSKNISVETFCSDIISERTYYRYLNGKTTITLDIFTKLMERLEISLGSITIYGVHFKAEDKGITRFIYRVFSKSYHDIKPIYEKVLLLDRKNDINTWFLDSYRYEYEFDAKMISKIDYQKAIDDLLSKIDLETLDNVRVISILLSKMEIDRNEYQKSIEKVIDQILLINFQIDVMFYFFAINRILTLLVSHNYQNLEKYKTLLDKAKEVFQYFYTRNVMMNYALYHAYYLKLSNKAYENELFTYSINALTMYHKDRLEISDTLINKTFNQQIEQVIEDNLENMLKQSLIRIID